MLSASAASSRASPEPFWIGQIMLNRQSAPAIARLTLVSVSPDAAAVFGNQSAPVLILPQVLEQRLNAPLGQVQEALKSEGSRCYALLRADLDDAGAGAAAFDAALEAQLSAGQVPAFELSKLSKLWLLGGGVAREALADLFRQPLSPGVRHLSFERGSYPCIIRSRGPFQLRTPPAAWNGVRSLSPAASGPAARVAESGGLVPIPDHLASLLPYACLQYVSECLRAAQTAEEKQIVETALIAKILRLKNAGAFDDVDWPEEPIVFAAAAQQPQPGAIEAEGLPESAHLDVGVYVAPAPETDSQHESDSKPAPERAQSRLTPAPNQGAATRVGASESARQKAPATTEHNKAPVPLPHPSSSRQVVRFPGGAVLGRSRRLEREGLQTERSSAPDSAVVRPVSLLRLSFSVLVELWRHSKRLAFVSSQLLAIREDLVAGKEYSALLFAVQETLVRICIEAGDLLALDAQLEWLFELCESCADDLGTSATLQLGCLDEFLAYRLARFIVTAQADAFRSARNRWESAVPRNGATAMVIELAGEFPFRTNVDRCDRFFAKLASAPFMLPRIFLPEKQRLQERALAALRQVYATMDLDKLKSMLGFRTELECRDFAASQRLVVSERSGESFTGERSRVVTVDLRPDAAPRTSEIIRDVRLADLVDFSRAAEPSLKEFDAKQLEIKDRTAEILKEKMDWADLSRSGTITDAERGLLQDFLLSYKDKDAASKWDFLSEKGDVLAKLFAKILKTSHRDEVAHYVLALLGDILEQYPPHAEHYSTLSAAEPVFDDCCNLLRRYVAADNEYASNRMLQVLGHLLSCPAVDPAIPAVSDVFSTVKTRLTSAKRTDSLVALTVLKTMLKRRELCKAFVERGSMHDLSALLRNPLYLQSSQHLYLLCFCIWLVSFHEELLREILENDIVSRLVDILKQTVREKITRVIFCTLRNLLDHQSFNEAMVVAGITKLLPSLVERKFNDEDVHDDIVVIDDTLARFMTTLTSFSKYQTEIMTGRLQWSPVHSEKFWRENADRFEDDGFLLIRRLIELLDSEDELTVEVACYDLGEFARFHPDGRKVVDKLGAKRKLMAKMAHKQSKIAKMALLSVQKLMVQNWESLTVAK